ncbi:MAG: P1 family peptidase [Sulfolobales archaeon]|nr:P1 family peptidase [Sulfolobales archaeon]MCX8208731.1 P1 family peptidase [Sulfolobales archaeon]MDW8010538.1 P1 family peptidase [Sulfolobales archaeon]
MNSLPRVRDLLELSYWKLRPGPRNSISDVAGVHVGHTTLVDGKGPLIPGKGPVRTGVTVVVPHGGNLYREKVVSAAHVINGFTKAVGLVQVEELGVIESPIALTNTLNVGLVADGLIEYSIRSNPEIGITAPTVNPVVLECNDGYLNDIQGRHVKQHHVLEALRRASEDFEEGSVGAGTGTIAFGFKGGVGTSSRIVPTALGSYVVGVLVQSNFGRLEDLIVGGVPVGKFLKGSTHSGGSGSINVVVATNAPLTSRQLRRVARRVQSGLARVGGYVYHGSGEVVVAFTTAFRVRHGARELASFSALPDEELNNFFRGVVEAVEEAVLNSMFNSTTMDGRDGRVVHQIPVDRVVELVEKHGAASTNRSGSS